MRTGERGFTLIELLIVIVIIGLLVAIAIPKFTNTKEKAYLAQIDNNTYSNSFPASVFTVSAGVNGVAITTVDAGWQATIDHTLTAKTCAIFVNAPPMAPAFQEGVPTCTP
jgi:prepilin-type N-terminal cleavage/methylation domain-containing protein